MRVSIRFLVVGVLGMSFFVCGVGCRSSATGSSSTGWSSPSWLSWNNWGFGNNSSSTALAQNKPSTTVPRPSGMTSPQATTSVAAGTGAAGGYTGATNPRYAAATTSGGYPSASQGYGSQPAGATSSAYGTPGSYAANATPTYGAQPASAYGTQSPTGQVQPTVGYQTGPYSMTSNSASTASPYAQAPASQYGGGYPAAGGSWNGGAASAPPTSGGYGASTYSTADQRGLYNTQEASPYASDPSQQGGYPAAGGYGQQPPTSPYGAAPQQPAAPSAAVGPWNSYSQPPANYQGSTQPAATPTATYEPAASNAYAASQPAAGGASSSTSPALPAALATDASSYRPGSTAGAYGVQNAGYQQPPAGSNSTYGNVYQR